MNPPMLLPLARRPTSSQALTPGCPDRETGWSPVGPLPGPWVFPVANSTRRVAEAQARHLHPVNLDPRPIRRRKSRLKGLGIFIE